MKFTHLHVHSHYSLLDGLAKIDDLIKKAKKYEMDSLALTDHGNLYGAIEFYKKAKRAGIKPILGVEAYIAPNGMEQKRAGVDGKRFHLTLLAKNNKGWENLILLVTKSNLEGFYYKPRIDKKLLRDCSEGIICLSGCFSGELAKAVSKKDDDRVEKIIKEYLDIFGKDFYLEIQPHMKDLVNDYIELSQKFNIPLVATQDVHYVSKDDKTAHEILLAVQTSSQLDDEDRLSLKKFDISMKSPEEMINDFKNIPEAIMNTTKIAESCNVEIELNKPRLPKFSTPEGYTAEEYLKKISFEKLSDRYPKPKEEIKERLSHELSVINRTGFADYFLIVQDFVNWAKERGIVVGPGRGSAAGSIVSYILGITNIDPIRYDLLFERFLNPDRIQVPDIDIDFTDTRRDEVISYVREKYGQDRVAQIITFGTMMARAAIRDTGRAMGLSYGFCDKIAKLIPFNTSIEEALDKVPELKSEYSSDPQVKELMNYAMRLEGVARHASVHACGVVISAESLDGLVPLQWAPQGQASIITQFDMGSVEDMGLLKMDFLGLKNLTIIEKTIRLIKENHGKEINVNELLLDDKKTFELLRRGETAGVFQLESSGISRYLKELKPSELEDIIVILSLYRPGPMELIPHYIKRKFGKEKITYLHPKLEPILKKTYGVGIYQEQMMRIARDLAGFTLSEADTLRKAIGKKIKHLLDEQKEKLINGMIKKDIDAKTANEIWELFPPFARYGFNRSHAASYAMISYQTAYLKANFPAEFMTSLLNVSASDIDRINFFVNESNRLKIEVLPPDVNASFQEFTAEEDKIRFGLLAIKNLGANIVKAIIEERMKGGEFVDISDFLKRVQHRDLNKKSLESLIKSGAFDSIIKERGQALENIEEMIKFNQAIRKANSSNQNSLFGSPTSFFTSLKFKPGKPVEKSLILSWEKELLGLYLTDHPLNAYLPKIKDIDTIPIKNAIIQKRPPTSKMRLAGVITGIQKIVTKSGKPMLFVKLEDLSDNLEILVFSETLAKTEIIWQPNKAVIVEGKISWKNDDPKFICDRVKEL